MITSIKWAMDNGVVVVCALLSSNVITITTMIKEPDDINDIHIKDIKYDKYNIE